ncbi:MAG TPA: hypothetical protein VNE62_08340, partial [Actinomycetota bacterium]|nr:hypothetical protein [Actinomycetota bacterium]
MIERLRSLRALAGHLRTSAAELRSQLRARKRLSAVVWAVALLATVQVLWGPPPRLILYGVAVGSLHGLLAMGLVLVYRSHRIINFAAGSMGAVPAVLMLTLMTTRGLTWFLAFPLALVLGGLVGGGTHAVVVRRFAGSPRLLLTVVTIGLSQLFAYLAFRLPGWLGTSALPPKIRTPLSGLHLCRADSPLGPLSRGCHRFLKADDFNGDLVFALLVVAGIATG